MSARTVQILVVDDNPTNLKLVSSILEFDGYVVVTANDAESALASIARALPDLILMDVGLPGIDGLTLTRMLKADPSTKHIRIVILTAFAMKQDREKAQAAGCDGYLTKPIDTRSISAQVAQWLTQPKHDLMKPTQL